MIAANFLDEAFEVGDALANPAQFLGADLVVRRLCRTPYYAERTRDARAFP